MSSRQFPAETPPKSARRMPRIGGRAEDCRRLSPLQARTRRAESPLRGRTGPTDLTKRGSAAGSAESGNDGSTSAAPQGKEARRRRRTSSPRRKRRREGGETLQKRGPLSRRRPRLQSRIHEASRPTKTKRNLAPFKASSRILKHAGYASRAASDGTKASGRKKKRGGLVVPGARSMIPAPQTKRDARRERRNPPNGGVL